MTLWKAVPILEAQAPKAFQIPKAIFATDRPRFLKKAITTMIQPQITPKPLFAIPVNLATAAHAA